MIVFWIRLTIIPTSVGLFVKGALKAIASLTFHLSKKKKLSKVYLLCKTCSSAAQLLLVVWTRSLLLCQYKLSRYKRGYIAKKFTFYWYNFIFIRYLQICPACRLPTLRTPSLRTAPPPG